MCLVLCSAVNSGGPVDIAFESVSRGPSHQLLGLAFNVWAWYAPLTAHRFHMTELRLRHRTRASVMLMLRHRMLF